MHFGPIVIPFTLAFTAKYTKQLLLLHASLAHVVFAFVYGYLGFGLFNILGLFCFYYILII